MRDETLREPVSGGSEEANERGAKVKHLDPAKAAQKAAELEATAAQKKKGETSTSRPKQAAT